MRFTFTVPGPPRGKERPRFNGKTGRTYTPPATKRAELEVVAAWRAAGSPTVGDGPIRASVVMVMRRPESHWRKDGTLSAAGQRSEWPTKKPDGDNAAKLVLDSLNGYAYGDDSQVVDLSVMKVWARPYEDEHTVVTVEMIRPLGLAA